MLKYSEPKRKNLISSVINIFIRYFCLIRSEQKSFLFSRYPRACLFFLLIIVLHTSCAAPTQIIQERSSSIKPEWIESPPQGKETLYFVGIKTSAETLEEGRKAALRNAMSDIGNFMGSKVESVFEEYISEVEQKLMHQFKSKSSATVKGARVVDSYYKKLTRIEKNFKIERYDVYVLVKFSKAEFIKEIDRQQKIKQKKIKTAYNYYLNGLNEEKRQKYYDARRYYDQALIVVESIEDLSIITGSHDIKNSDELRLSIQAHLKNVNLQLSRVELSIHVQGPPRSNQAFISNFVSALNEHGFTITDKRPAIKINGNVFVTESSYIMNNHFFYAQGSVSAQRTIDKQIVAEYPFKVKGAHRLKKQAALSALAEAGIVAGNQLSEMILKKETMK